MLDPRADFRYGVVITEGKYSAERRYQVVVPIIDRVVEGHDGPELLEPTRWDVVPAAQPWTRTLPLEQPMLDTAGTISLTERWQKGNRRTWLKKQVEVLEGTVDAATLAEVEARIIERLRL